MMYKIIKTTPSNRTGYSLGGTFYSYRQAVDMLKTIKINYDLDRDETQGNDGYQEQAAYLYDKNRSLVAYEGGDRIEYHLRKVQS